jgi:acyl CoA:acetate/3-ketoacid CoA transferase alpha subunit/acyl CoA:acetate/3-ketoacid CoA transferase beta subunit
MESAGAASTQAGKVIPLGEAVRRFVQPGDVLHVGYSDARPNAALMEVARQFNGSKPEFTLVTAGVVAMQHALIELGLVRRVIASFAGENYPSARPSPAFQRAYASGTVAVENWSLWSLIARLMAAGLGIPFMPINSLKGSSLAKDLEGKGYREIPDPAGGADSIAVVEPLVPDVTFIQAIAADEMGNVIMAAPYGESHWGSLAASRGVIACVETVVDPSVTREHSALVRIPAHAVLAVCEVPFGSHPYGAFNPGLPGVDNYSEDAQFLADSYQASKTAESFRDHITEWVLDVEDHAGLLEKLGHERVEALKSSAHRETPPTAASAAGGSANGWNALEALVVQAARQVSRRVKESGHDAILAGVGQANLAAWTAATLLEGEGAHVDLMAEIGMFGYRPQPGEPFIFSSRNLPTCTMMGDVLSVLGTFVGGPGTSSLGVVGAAQIDGHGNTNSTFTDDGAFLLGSGGANDILSSSDESLVVVPHSRHRLSKDLPYVTSPGDRVRTIVSDIAVFQRGDHGFVLTGYLPDPGESCQDVLARIREGCGWDFEVAEHLEEYPPPTAEELALLRSFDPEAVFRRGPAIPGSESLVQD